MVARRLLGEGCELRIFDPEVQLSRLLGANRSYIDANIPHPGSRSIRGDPRRVAAGRPERFAAGEAQAGASPRRPGQLPNRDRLRCHYEGICW